VFVRNQPLIKERWNDASDTPFRLRNFLRLYSCSGSKPKPPNDRLLSSDFSLAIFNFIIPLSKIIEANECVFSEDE